jgi:hypothetical protein
MPALRGELSTGAPAGRCLPARRRLGSVLDIDDRWCGGRVYTDDLNEILVLHASAHQKELLAQSQEAAGRLGGLGRTASSSDSAAAVTVWVRADGAVTQARLHDQWRARLGRRDLGEAVAEALTGAQDAATRLWAESIEDGSITAGEEPASPAGRDQGWDEGRDEGRDQGRDEGGEAGDPVDFARELLALIGEVESYLPDLPGMAQNAVDHEASIGGPAGGITAVARQGALVRLDVDPRWLAEAPRNRIDEELSAVLAAALPGLRNQATSAMRGVAPVGRLMDLLDDPATLFARLGLGDANRSGDAGNPDQHRTADRYSDVGDAGRYSAAPGWRKEWPDEAGRSAL